ncbi:MAG: hypothetical protein PHS37_01580, partial [Candidatus Omnitrophica bacterium]|nr:hypothetical protein [Candidatus Omnitrophota bacterium]
MNVIFAKYNRSRLPEFQTATVIYEEEGRRRVKKTALDSRAVPHIRRIFENFTALEQNYKKILAFKPARLEGDSLVCDYLNGESFEARMSDMVFKQDMNGFMRLIGAYGELLKRIGSYAAGKTDNAFARIFGDGIDLAGVRCLTMGNIDLTFDNILVAEGSATEYRLIDYEWVFDFPVPTGYIVFRSLHYFYYKYGAIMKGLFPIERSLKYFKIGRRDVEMFRRMEDAFQKYVHGTDVRGRYIREYKSLDGLEDALREKRSMITGLMLETKRLQGALTQKDDEIVERIEAVKERDAFIAYQAGVIQDKESVIFAKDSVIREKESVIGLKNDIISEVTNRLAAKEAVIMEKDAAILEKESVISRKEAIIHEQAGQITAQEAIIVEKDAVTLEQKSIISRKEAIIHEQAGQITAQEAIIEEKDAVIR